MWEGIFLFVIKFHKFHHMVGVVNGHDFLFPVCRYDRPEVQKAAVATA